MALYNSPESEQNKNSDESLKFMQSHLKNKRNFKPIKISNHQINQQNNEQVSDSYDQKNLFTLHIPADSYDPLTPNDYYSWADKFGSKSTSTVPTERNPKSQDASKNLLEEITRKPASTSLKGDSFGQAMLAKYGWKEGQGLGKNQQGISVPLNVQKIGRNTAKIVDKHAQMKKCMPKLQNTVESAEFSTDGIMVEEKQNEFDENASKVLLILNMVDLSKFDKEFESNLCEEWSNTYGTVIAMKLYIPEEPNSNQKCGILVEFDDLEFSKKAFIDINEGIFYGRTVKAIYYDENRFRSNDLGV